MPIFELNGKKYNVQDQHIADFASEYPDATTIEERDGKKYRVKSSDYQSFQSEIGAAQPEVQTPYALGATPVEKPKKKGLPEQDYIYEDELQKDRQGFEKEQYQGLSWKDKAILRVMGKNARQMGVNADPAREILTLDKQKGVGLNDLEERKNVMQAQRNQVSTMRDEIDQILIDTQDEDQFAGIPMAGPMGATMSGMRASTRQNNERRDYMAAKRSLTDAANIIEEADRHAADGTYGGWYETSFAGGAARGFGDKLFDARTWSFGVADKVDNDRLNQALEDFDNGKELTKSQQALLDAKAVEMATQAYFGSYLGRGYKAGQVTAEAIPFMFEFIINPASAIGKSAGSMMARYALKRFGKGAATKALSRGARVAGDIAGAATMSATTGLGRVAADAAERMAGDIHYDIDQDNQTVFAGHTKGEDPATAYRKAFGATTIENYSEMFGNYFSPILGGAGKMLRKGAESLGAGKVVKMLDDVAASDLAKVVSDFENNAQWSGTLSEYAEEVASGIMNAIFVGDQTLDTDEQTGVFNLDNNINTLLGVALLGGAMSTIKTAGYPIHKYQADKRIVTAETDAVSAFGNAEKWAEVKSKLNLEDAVERGKALRDVLADKNLTEEQKVVAFKYVEALQNRDGVRIGEMKHYTDETVPQEQKEVEQSFDNGYTLTTPEEKQDANSNLAYWADKLRVDFQMNEDADPEDLFEGYENPLDALKDEKFANEDVYNDALQYIYAKATMDGAVQNVRDQIDARIAENNARIDGVKNETDNTLMPATLKQGDRQVFIVRGNIAQLDDGSIDGEKSDGHIFIVDAQTLKPEMIAPSAIRSLGAIENADTAKETQATQIAELMATEASAQMDGTLGFVQGDTYNILGEDGIQHTAQVVADNGDGSVQVVVDGAQEATTLPKEQVQAMSDAYHKARAIAYNEQKKAEEVAEQEAQVAEEAPQSALEQIPTNENGEQVFEEAPAETTWAALIEMNEGDVAEAADTAQQMLEVSQKELEKATNEKAGVGTSVAEIQKIKAERKAKINALQNRVNYWNNVLSLNTPTQEVAQTEEVAEPIEEVAEEPIVKEEENPIVEEEIAPIIEEAQVAEPIVEAEEVVEPIVEQSRPKVKNISKKEDARRQPLRERVAEWVDKLGVPVVVMETFSDIENADAKREIRKGGRIAGWYEPSTGAVMLYMPHLTDMAEIDKTITHEIVAHKGLAHMLGKNKHNALLDRVWDMMSEEAKAKYINYPNVNGNTRRAADEYIAFLSEGVNLTELDQSAWDKIVGFVRELLAEVGINMQLTDADIADLIRLSYTNLVRENQKAKETKGADDINEQEGQALFSIRTYEESGRENLQKFLKGQVKKKRITKADAEAIEATMEQMYETAVEYKDKFAPFGAWSEAEVVKGKDGQPVFSVVKKNGEYTMNLDFSTVCKKRRTLDAVFSEMIDRGLIDMIPMVGEQIAEINNIIRDYGFETACALCFVDAKRFRVAQVADKFCDMWNPMTKMSEEELQGVINEYGKKVVRGKIAKHLIEHPEDRVELGRENFIESNGFEQMEINHPEILSLYKQAQGTSLAKIPFGDVQYLNEIEGNSWTPEAAYAVGGVRLQSFSDYVPRMFFDYMQMTAGLASKKLPVHAYTKEPLFAKQFGLTGMKINLSLVPKVVEGGVAAGLDADGNYAWMEGETFPFEEAMALQNAEGYRENCGTIAVGVSDEHIEKMLDDPNIRMIIPYHKSGLNPLVAKKNRIAEFTDYTNVQNTRSANGTKLEKEDLKDMPDFNSLMHDEGMDARQAAQAYLDWCDSKGFIPKFNKFRGHQNYYKLLEDFTTIVPNAEGVETTYPQREVTMTFPTEESAFGSIESLIREGLEEDAILEGKRDEKLGEIVDTIEKEMVRFRFIGQQGAANLDKAEEATTRLDDLAVARDMWVEGKDAKTIKAATGWEHGADGKWRYEVMDIKVESPEKWVNKRGALKLPTIIGEDDNLFVEYPDLRDVKVKKTAGAGGGFYSPKDNTISVAVGTLKKATEILADPARFGQTEESFRPIYDGVISEVEGTLTHEIQHFIQHKEWFAKGGSPEMLNPSYDKDLVENQYAHMVDAMNRKIREYNALSPIERRTYNAITLRNSIMSDQRKIKKYAKSVRLGDEGYRRLAGEVEARNADRRRNMPMGERLASLASETEDVARKDQIFIFDALADANQKAQFRVTPEMDAQYLSLVEEGNLEEAQKMVDAAANAAGYNADESWKKAHRAPRKSEDNVNPFNTEELVPADYWAHPEWYTQIRHYQTDRESYYNMLPAINKYKRLVAEGKQDEADKVTVTMYRGVDKRANKKESTFRNGDWITPSRSYALLSAPEGNARVISQDVLLKDIWWDGNSINEWGYDDGANYVYQDTKNNRKSADAVTYDDNGNVIPLSKRFNKRSEDVRFRVVEPAPTFYSNAANAVLGIKQEKATPEQWLKMIEKNGGLKAGEDKWLGLSDWLKASDKKTFTKQEVLDYINENQIQIEDVEYRDRELVKLEIEGSQQFINLQDEYMGIFEDYMENPEADMSEYEAEQYARDAMVEQFGNYFNVAFSTFGKELYVDDAEFAAKLLGLPYAKELNQTRLDYTTQGLTDKREIALTIPTIESWNETDDIHFGDAGDGRAIAWIRFGETVDEYGFRVLVIDEIQSKRHQEGREKGYRPSDVDKYLKDNNVEVIETGEFYEFYRDGELDRRFSKGLLHYKVDEAKKLYVAGYNKSDIPEAPFEKNWAELAMKRMLRYAAENGYDAIAWTKGDQQAERYDLSKSVERIDAEDNNVEEASDGAPIAKNITIRTSNWPIHLYVDANGVIRGGQYANHQLSEVVGKGIAEKLMQKGDVSLSGDGLRIGGEGMKGFYDEMLPRFMNKYGKKWGVKVQDVTLPFVEEAGRTMHSVDVTDSMRDSVMQGQSMFRVVDSKKPFKELEERYKRLDKSNTEALNAWRDEKAATIQSVITAISDELGFEPPIMVFNGGKDIQEVVDHIVDAYKEMANLDVDKEWVKTYIEESKAIGLYWPDAGVITSDVSNYDNTNDVLQASSMLMHENTHHLVNSQFDNQDLEAIWDEAVNAGHPLVNHIENKYKNVDNAGKGNEVLAYAIGNIAKNTRENLFNYVKGEPISEENLLEKAEYSLPLGKFALSEILNTYKNDLRRSKEEVGGSNREANRGDHRVGRLLRNRTGIRRKAVKEAAELFAKQLNTPIRIVEDVNTITDNNAKLQERKRNAKGWFDNKANEVVVVLPNATSIEDVRETIFHEVVGHKGLRELVGKERYDAFLEKVYRGASETIRERIARRAAKLGWDFNLATDEYLADLAEEGFEERENRNFFEVVRDLFLDMLSKAKIALGYNISDNDMRYMLWRTYQMQRSKGAMVIAEDMVMQQKLGVGNFAPNDTQFRVAMNEMDKKYLEAVEKEDSKKVAKLVKEAAKLSMPNTKVVDRYGYPKVVYHGTSSDEQFNVFDGSNGIFLTSSPSNAEEYTRARSSLWSSPIQTGRVMPLFVNIENPLEVDANKRLWRNINVDWSDTPVTTSQIAKYAKEHGYDGVIIKKVRDNLYDEDRRYADVYIAFRPNQVKDAGAVYERRKRNYFPWDEYDSLTQEIGATYDDNGNLIPLTERFNLDNDDVRFRAISPSDISTKGIKQGIRNEYDKLVKTSAYQSREASQDSMLSLRRFMEMTAKAYEIPMDAIKDWENAYQSENALSSKNEAQIEEFDRLYGAPLIQTVQELRKKGYTYEQIDDYLQIKHGIERNREMAVRAAISDEEGKMDKEKLEKWNAAKERVSNDQSLDSWEKEQHELDRIAKEEFEAEFDRDYSGITAMYPDEKKIEDAVKKGYAEVNDFEKNVGQNLINELWRRIRAANMQTLNKTYRTGLISKETFDSISSMYSYYVPLRGFAETTSDEVYGYLNNEPMAFNAPIRKARGRSSKADQVLPNVLSAAHSAILQGNRNTMKNHFLNFVQHYPTDLISVQNMWVEYDKATKQWVAKFPELEDTDSPEEVATKTQAFEEKMKELKEKYPKQYKQVTQKIDVPYVVQKQYLKQHQIVVKRNGVDVVLTVNGSPRLAIVMNGTQPTKTLLGEVKDWASARTRYLSGMYTSYHPDFVVSNYMRDAIYTNSTVWLKESPAYAARFNKNNVTTCNPVNMGRLILKYSAGTLDMNNEVEKAFYDFVMNGGETGYAKLASIEQLKKDIGHMIEPTMFDNVKALGKKLAFINRSAESSARFAAFLTSRQMGRSVARSVADAKEISVNFNKKGAGDLFMGAKDQTWVGKMVAGSMGWTMPMYAFFNAGIQGLNNFLRIYKHAPLKTTALTTGLFLLGTLIASMLEGDDEEEYYALPESVRRQNIVFRAGDNAWVKIPLPIEMRAIYGLGEMFTSIAKGKEDLSDHGIAYKMAEQLSQVLPINVLEGEGGLGTLVPTFVAPIAEVMANEDWAGLPIYREDIYKGDSDIPEYLRVYARTGEGYVAASEFLNDITGGDNRERGALGFVNPAVIEHLVDGYLGGPAQFMNKVVSSAEMAFGDKEFDLRSVPFVNRVLMSDNTTMSKKTINNYYYRHKEEAERIDRLVKNYQKDMNDPTKTDEERAYAAEKAQEKRDSEEWMKAQEFLRRTSAVEDIEKQFKEAPEGTSDEVVYKVKDFANEVYKKAEK
jgi:hypothetical protein